MKTRLTFLTAISALVTIRFITNTVWATEQAIQEIASNTITRQLPASAISVNGELFLSLLEKRNESTNYE